MDAWDLFYRKYPALLYGLAFLLGVYWALTPSWVICIPTLGLLGSAPWAYWHKKYDLTLRFGLALGILSIALFTSQMRYHFPTLPSEGIKGEGIFVIDSMTTTQTHYGKFWTYKGTLKRFESAVNIPMRLSIPQKGGFTPPAANQSYHLVGTLKQTGSGYRLKLDPYSPWTPVAGTNSLAEIRSLSKNWVRDYIHRHIYDLRSADFLSGLSTGDFEDRLMQYELGRFGLQHIMAISGFHFSILAGFFAFGLRSWLPHKRSSLVLVFLMTSYAVFLGFGPSILRAWIAIVIALGGILFEKRGSGINSLGVALLIILAYDPLMAFNVGFQFSFLATGAILIIYPQIEKVLRKLLMIRPLRETLDMSAPQQHGYILLAFLRQGIALTIAVNAIAVPLMLYYFNKFPLLSLFYNIFYPFLVSISMLLLLLGICCPWLHSLNSLFTSFLLDFTYAIPADYDIVWRVPDLPLSLVIFLITVILYISAYYSKVNNELLFTQNSK